MPATTFSNSGGGDYLRAPSPAWVTLQNYLVILSAIVILRFILRRLFSWLTLSNLLGSRLIANTTSHSVSEGQFNISEAYFRPREGPFHHQAGAQLNQQHWTMDEKNGSQDINHSTANHQMNFQTGDDRPAPPPPPPSSGTMYWDSNNNVLPRGYMTRPPPAPPLIPPELSSAVLFLNQGNSHNQDDFFSQPNPDYTSSSSALGSIPQHPTSSTTTTTTTSTTLVREDMPSHPRMFSYSRTIPIDSGPIPQEPTTDDASLSSSARSNSSSSPVSSSPPAPPMDHHGEIKVQGEIVGVLDGEGAGWTRHTRVYGGGVCLACAASGRKHGEGGFYGANVRPEEMMR